MLNTEDANRFEEIVKELKTYGLNEYMAVPPKRKLNLHKKSTESIINQTRAFAYDYNIRIEFTTFCQEGENIYIEDREGEVNLMHYKTPETLLVMETLLGVIRGNTEIEQGLKNGFQSEFN
jgi:hypothetical protein